MIFSKEPITHITLTHTHITSTGIIIDDFLWLFSFSHPILADLFQKYIPSLPTSPISKAQILVKATVFLAGLLQRSPDQSFPFSDISLHWTQIILKHESEQHTVLKPSLAGVTEHVQSLKSCRLRLEPALPSTIHTSNTLPPWSLPLEHTKLVPPLDLGLLFLYLKCFSPRSLHG